MYCKQSSFFRCNYVNLWDELSKTHHKSCSTKMLLNCSIDKTVTLLPSRINTRQQNSQRNECAENSYENSAWRWLAESPLGIPDKRRAERTKDYFMRWTTTALLSLASPMVLVSSVNSTFGNVVIRMKVDMAYWGRALEAGSQGNPTASQPDSCLHVIIRQQALNEFKPLCTHHLDYNARN